MADTQSFCPKCKQPLMHLRRKGMLVEMCSGCAGMWFDAGELTMLLEVYKEFDPKNGEDTDYRCVRCQGALKELSFPGTDVLIDRCVECQGVWLDRGELQILKRLLAKLLPKDQPHMNERAQVLLTEVEIAGEQRFKCPKCESKLWHLKRNGMIVEMCSSCNGMWFDAGELTVLLEVYRKFDANDGELTEVPCVRCGANMRELKYPGTEVVIDRCPECQGIWLDKGEYEDLKGALSKLVPDDGKDYNTRAQELFAGLEEASFERSRCPRCQGGLRDRQMNGLPVESCKKCEGTWFDAGELTIVLGVSRRLRLSKGSKTELRCIKCPDEFLKELEYPNTGVMVDSCPDCRSIWLDGGELQALGKACGVDIKYS